MKFRTATFLLIAACSAAAQGTFQNLNFESATLSPSTGNLSVPVSAALPGWEAFLGASQQTDVVQNEAALNAPSIDILGPNTPSGIEFPSGFPGIIGGNFSVVVQGGFSGSPESASIEQTGTVPYGDESLQFKAWTGPTTPSSEWSVSFAGNTLTLYALATTSQYTLYGADVSAYAGQTGALEFFDAGQGAPSFLELDDITFSTSAVREPNAAVLASLGGLLFAAYRRRAKGIS